MSEFKTALLRPFLPPDVRLRLRHQRLDADATKRSYRYLATADLDVTLVKAVDGSGAGRGMRLVPEAPPGMAGTRSPGKTERGRWYWYGAVEWDYQHITVVGTKSEGVWEPASGGLRPGFDAVEIFQAGRRPPGCGECLKPVAAIVTVGLTGRHMQRVYFLDAESRSLGHIPAPGFAEDDLVRLAEAAGIAYRRYAFTLARFASLRVLPPGLCEALFTRSARRAKLVREEVEVVDDWYSDPWFRWPR